MGNGYESYAVILTAVEVETASVMNFFGGWHPCRVPGDEQRYYETDLVRGKTRLRLITAQQKVMGMTASATLAMKAIYTFRPKYLIMSGIAAGTGDKAEQMYGDVLVPDVVWDYSTGKYVGSDEAEIRFGDLGFLPRPISLRLDPELLEIVQGTASSPDNEFKVHIGPLACGNSVVANSQMVDRQILPIFQQTVGLDMESYGIFYAASTASNPRPKAIVVKSICDFANSEKDDRFQRFAAFTSAGYVKYLLETRLP